MQLPMFFALGLCLALVVACVWIAIKWREAVADRDALEEIRLALKAYIAELKPDAELGKQTRRQRERALIRAREANAARKPA